MDEEEVGEDISALIAILATADLLRFAVSVVILLTSGIILHGYLYRFLAGKILWQQSGALFDRMLRAERQVFEVPLSPVSPNEIVAEPSHVERQPTDEESHKISLTLNTQAVEMDVRVL
jgi:hypothetical protein